MGYLECFLRNRGYNGFVARCKEEMLGVAVLIV
jgi:hypothetical protein